MDRTRQSRLRDEAINLDCATDDDLRILEAKHDAVATYAKRLLAARVARLAGDIGTALRHEHIMEICYGRMPDNLKW